MDALYFPNLSLPASTWVNPTLLYFDRLAVIAPEGRHSDLFDDRTRELLDLGLAHGISPRWDKRDSRSDERLLSYLLGKASAVRSYGKIERVHIGKLVATPIAAALVDAGVLRRVDGPWLEGADWAIGHLMSYMALQLSLNSADPLPLITDERAAFRIMTGSREAHKVSRRLRAVSTLLPVPPHARPSDLARFRRRHENELHRFRDYVEALIGRDAFEDGGDDRFDRRLMEAERVRDHLISEMDEFNWRQQGLSISLAIASTAAPLLEHSPWSVGVGLLGLAIAAGQSIGPARRHRRAAHSPLVYATQVVGRWQPTAEQTLY